MAEDTAIEVVLKRSGLTFIVPPDKSILQVLIEEAIDPCTIASAANAASARWPSSKACPTIATTSSARAERAENKVMQICVSRAKTPRLVIDLLKLNIGPKRRQRMSKYTRQRRSGS